MRRPHLVHPEIFNKMYLQKIKNNYTQHFYYFLAIFLVGGIAIIYYKYLVRGYEKNKEVYYI